MIKKTILWILVILWMGVIFYFSSFNGIESEEQSRGFLYNTLGSIIEFFDKDISFEEKEALIIKYDPIVRKIAHACEYFVLSLLVLLAMNYYELDIKKYLLYSFLICVLYACSDEIHQTFVSERSGRITDVLVDSLGILFGTIIGYLFKRRKV